MKAALRIPWYVVLCLLLMCRAVLALPFLMVYVGAVMAGDRETEQRMDRWIERFLPQ